MRCNSSQPKFCNKRNTIGIRCPRCNWTIYCSDYCLREDSLSHQRICFSRECDRRRALVDIVTPVLQPGERVNLSQAYMIRDQKKKLRTVCVGEWPGSAMICVFCGDRRPYNIVKCGKTMEYLMCSTCLRNGRFMCSQTLMNDSQCIGVNVKEKGFLLFYMNLPNDIIYCLLCQLMALGCEGCRHGKKVVKDLMITKGMCV